MSGADVVITCEYGEVADVRCKHDRSVLGFNRCGECTAEWVVRGLMFMHHNGGGQTDG